MKVQEPEVEASEKLPHLLKYMGSKREIIDFVKESIFSLEVKDTWLCDLFAGTGIVSGHLKADYNIHANDIQEYSSILSNTYLSKIKGKVIPDIIDDIYFNVCKLVTDFRSKNPDLIFDYTEVKHFNQFIELEKKQQNLLHYKFDLGFHLFAKCYSGTYWSYEQCLWIDAIRAVAEQYNGKVEYYAILSSLIYSMSYASQSTGHYAQYRDATVENMKDIMVYRKKDIWTNFEKKFHDILKINGNSRDFRVTTLDYVDCLRVIENNSIVYADPPYQSVHYSRFYHALETLVKYDYPKLLYKGRYREERHQSPFCKKTTVKEAFSILFKGVKDKNSHLVLSYSDTGMITLEEIQKLSKQFLNDMYSSYVLEKDHIHSKMGRNDGHNQEVTEYSIIFKRK